MKVEFKDVDFGHYEPHTDFEYEGSVYRMIEVECETQFGKEFHKIAETDLGDVLLVYDDDDTDNTISYYADDSESVYSILKAITGENID